MAGTNADSREVGPYLLGTFLGMAPGLLATSVFGSQIAAMLEDPARLNYWVIGIATAAFVVITIVASRWLARESAAEGT